MSIERVPLNASEPGNLTRHLGGNGRSEGSLLKSATRSRSAAMPTVSQRNLTKLMRAAQACGVASYEIIYEKTGQIRLAVGGAPRALGTAEDAETNDFDSELG